MPQAAFHAIISGRVQGVYFRAFAERCADRLEVRGYVRNRPDGAVEVVAEGEQAALDAFLEDLKQGPRGAHVENIQVDWQPPTGQFTDFHIRY